LSYFFSLFFIGEHCDQRFFDRDELYRHFRKEHYYCHFCDSDGHEEYYKDYSQLREHFIKSHFLCELDDCSSNAAVTHEYVVFRSELDLQAHKKQKHAKSKSEAKSLGKLNIEFTINDPKREKLRRNYKGYVRSTHERGSNNPTAAASNLDSTDEEWYDRPNRENQSKIQTIDFDPNVIRISQEEYEKNEQKRRIERLKEQYENANATSSTLTVTSEASSSLAAVGTLDTKNMTEITASNTTASEKSNNENQHIQWRNIIGGAGSAPKLNAETEFPSLIIDNSSGPLSLESIGAFIQHSNKNNPWKKNKLGANSDKAITKNNAAKPLLEKVEKDTTDSKKNEKKTHLNSTIKSGQLENKLLQNLTDNNAQMVEANIKEKSNETLKEKNKSKSKILTEKQVNESNTDNKKKQLSQTTSTYSSFLSDLSEATTPKPPQPPPPPGFNSVKTNFNILNLNDISPPPGFKTKLNNPTKTGTVTNSTTSSTNLDHTKPNNQQITFEEDFPSLSTTNQITSNILPQKSNNLINLIEEFPPLSLESASSTETRYGALPTPAIFSNPSSHLSLTNKKKHRLQK
jgi:hypothetical protein